MGEETSQNNMNLLVESNNITKNPLMVAGKYKTGVALTPREIEILQLAANGLTTSQIAKHIHLSTDTIESHRKNMIRKMGVYNITHAVAEGMRHKLIK
jgi:DNA-binding NarL/FixJ family response regulator